jgi:hypothetical protein
MEEDIHRSHENHISASGKRVKDRLEAVVEIAEERHKYEAAHNPEINKALATVKQFIIRKRRVCYGGTAMNAILPKEKRFYNPEMDLPDYDFFTPESDADIHDLVKELKSGGFEDVHHRLGIHEGTSKIFVNFVAIADITAISKEVYGIFLKRAIKKEGMYYTDPDILRMMMYLEISRPKAMVSRWDKVFERLQLINGVFPPKAGRARGSTRKAKHADHVGDVRTGIYDFCIDNQRILITGDLDKYYGNVIRRATPNFNLEMSSDPIGFICPDVKADAKVLQKLLGGPEKCKLYLHEPRGEIVPQHVEIRCNGIPIAFLLDEAACHAYLNFPLRDGRSIAIASLDTLITIYYSLSIFTKRLKELIPGINYKIAEFIKLTEENRRHKDPNVPAFPISCRGYQKGFPTLLREKAARVKKARETIQMI